MIYNISPQDQISLNKLQNTIESFRQKLAKIDYINNQETFFTEMHNFWNFLGTQRNKKVVNLFLLSKYFHQHSAFFHSMENYYTRAIEAADAFLLITKQLSKNLSFLDVTKSHVSKATYQQTNHEMKMLDLSQCKKMVIIGCGCLPETILYIHDNSSINEIIGIDDNQEAIFVAGEMIRHQNLKNINLLHYNSKNYDYSNVDAVIITNMMKDKKTILKRIASTSKDHIQILARTPILLGHMFYEDASQSLDKRLYIETSQQVSDYFLEETLLIKKLNL